MTAGRVGGSVGTDDEESVLPAMPKSWFDRLTTP